eukprot:1134422-Pelagomonas_calceolata.AAC.1
MVGAGRALMCNFRRKYDIVNKAKGVSTVIITVFASSLVVGQGSISFILTGREVDREEEFTVHSISLVGRDTGAVASTNGSIRVSNNDGSEVAINVHHGLYVFLHFNSASEGFQRVN